MGDKRSFGEQKLFTRVVCLRFFGLSFAKDSAWQVVGFENAASQVADLKLKKDR